MPPNQVVHTAISAVANRIAHTGTATTTALTDSAVDRLYSTLTRRLNTSVIGARVLKNLESHPTATATRTATEQAVAAEADADHQFADELRHLVGQLPFTPPQPDAPTTTPRLGVIAAIAAAIAVILLAVNATILVKVILPRAGLTEGARLDRLAGTWTNDEAGTGRLVIRPDGTLAVTNESISCPGRVTSPARSEYVLEMDCGMFRSSIDAKLNLLGDELTLTAPGSPETTILNRQ